MRVGVVRFPGSNCDADAFHAVELAGANAVFLWHDDADLHGSDAIILPGGFAYGDYLRAGVIARFSPVMRSVADAAARGVPVLGICNGFQVLAEAHLLPGALLRNEGLRFVHRWVTLRLEDRATPFTAALPEGVVLRMPVAHGEGRYYDTLEALDGLERDRRVVFRYLDNPNGSVRDIAGVRNEAGNVLGLMPHPERADEPLLGSADGLLLFRSLVESAAGTLAGVAR
jgi:phosphoribosylformylglycinamidine synthase subunit PurQ / glutaminase